MKNTQSTKSVKINLTPWMLLLTVVLAVAKIAGVINIGWVWVLAPLWVSFLFLVALTLLLAGLALKFKSVREELNRR